MIRQKSQRHPSLLLLGFPQGHQATQSESRGRGSSSNPYRLCDCLSSLWIHYAFCLIDFVGHFLVVSLIHLTPIVLSPLLPWDSLSSPETITHNYNWTQCRNQNISGNYWCLNNDIPSLFLTFGNTCKIRWYTNTYFFAKNIEPSEFQGFPSQWTNKERYILKRFCAIRNKTYHRDSYLLEDLW